MKSETPPNSKEEPRDADDGDAPRPIARALFVLDMRNGDLASTGAPLGAGAVDWIRGTAARTGQHAPTPHPRMVRIESLDGEPLAVAGRFIRSGSTHVKFAGFIAAP